MDTSNRWLLFLQMAAGVAAVLWGKAPELFQLLLILMVADIVLGVIAGAREKALSSETAYFGIRKKAAMIILVLVTAAVQVYARSYVGEAPAANFLSGFFCWYELNSLVENAARAGAPVPAWLRELFAKLPSVTLPDLNTGERDDPPGDSTT